MFYWGSDPISESNRLVTVEFFSGHVKLKMGMLGSDWTTVYSPNPINDGKFHEVSFRNLLEDIFLFIKVKTLLRLK